MKRSESEEKLLVPGIPSGSFLIRRTLTTSGYTLSLSIRFEESVRHYLINTVTMDKITIFFIYTEAPFKSLARLVQHYIVDADGLCCKLTQPYRLAELLIKSRHSYTNKASKVNSKLDTGQEQAGEGNSHAINMSVKNVSGSKNEESSSTKVLVICELTVASLTADSSDVWVFLHEVKLYVLSNCTGDVQLEDF